MVPGGCWIILGNNFYFVGPLAKLNKPNLWFVFVYFYKLNFLFKRGLLGYQKTAIEFSYEHVELFVSISQSQADNNEQILCENSVSITSIFFFLNLSTLHIFQNLVNFEGWQHVRFISDLTRPLVDA